MNTLTNTNNGITPTVSPTPNPYAGVLDKALGTTNPTPLEPLKKSWLGEILSEGLDEEDNHDYFADFLEKNAGPDNYDILQYVRQNPFRADKPKTNSLYNPAYTPDSLYNNTVTSTGQTGMSGLYNNAYSPTLNQTGIGGLNNSNQPNNDSSLWFDKLNTPVASSPTPTSQPTMWDSVSKSLKHDFDDVVYGAKRGLSGMTLGGSDWLLRKAGITDDDYLAERDAEGIGATTRMAGMVSEIGGNALGAGAGILKSLGRAGLTGASQASIAGGIEGAVYGLTESDTLAEVPQNMLVNGVTGLVTPYALDYAGKPIANGMRYATDSLSSYKIGKAFDRLTVNPYEGNADDLIAKMGNNREVSLLRGAAIPDEFGKPIVAGRTLKKHTGSERNYGLDKLMYKHEVTKEEAQNIPHIFRKYNPAEISNRGQKVYAIDDGGTYPFVTVASPHDDKFTIASAYRETRNPNRPLSTLKSWSGVNPYLLNAATIPAISGGGN